MAFNQFKLDKSINQSRDIFDKYIYETDDTVADILTPGYFSNSRFVEDNDWAGSIIECVCADGYLVCSVDASGSASERIKSDALKRVARRQVLRASDTSVQTIPSPMTEQVVSFGSAPINGPSDPVQMTAANRFIFNESGNYHLRLSTQAGRASNPGIGTIYLGIFLDPGIGSFIQFGQSVEFVLPNSNSDFAYQAELTADIQAGWEFEVRFQRVGASDAGLYSNIAVPSGWNDVFSADALISKYFID